jgi:hypothetical protein
MALFIECMPSCAQIVLDTADIVRDGDVTHTSEETAQNCEDDGSENPPSSTPTVTAA